MMISSGYMVRAVDGDGFRWSDDGGVTWSGFITISGAAQVLSYGVTVTFGAVAGYTTDDIWGADAWIIRCIDWRYGVPYPGKGTTGLGVWRHSSEYGSIIEVVSLDCEIPNDGPTCT